MTQLRENISLELGLDETASGDEETLLTRRLNQAVREVLLRTHCYVISGTIALSADDNEYELNDALSTDALAVETIINSDNVPLQRVSVEEIHELRRGTSSTSSNVWKYALNGANLLMLYPTPSASGSLTVYYVPKPTEMSSGAHDPSATTYGNVPVELHEAIELWATWRMSTTPSAPPQVAPQEYLEAFEREIVKAKTAVRRRGGRKLGPARVGRRIRVPRDPSADVGYW